jgi:AcrR family transcriptional regulator
MGTTERRERERQELRTKILDAARELFVTHGYDAVTMRKIAGKIEYSPTALYLHFEDKDTLIRALCENDFLAFAGAFAEVMTLEDPIDRIARAADVYCSFALQCPNQYRLMFMTPPPGVSEKLASRLDKTNPEQNAYEFLRMNVADAMRAGRLRPELTDVELVAQTLWAGVHGIVSLHIAKQGEDWVTFRDPRHAIAAMRDALMRGLLRTSTPPAPKPGAKRRSSSRTKR